VDHQPEGLFDSIESAHEYIKILAEVVSDVKKDLETDIKGEEGTKFPRRVDAIRLASYKLDKLQLHMNASSRILNDLRSIRRLVFRERKVGIEATSLYQTLTVAGGKRKGRP
jgi:hypothetical protein